MRNLGLAIVLAVVPVTTINAEEALSEAQLKELFVGNTIYGEHARKGWRAIRYLAPDGKMTQFHKDKNKYSDGAWSIDGSNFCWEIERVRKTCGTWVKSGDEYHFLKEHSKHIWTIKEVKKGNAEKM